MTQSQVDALIDRAHAQSGYDVSSMVTVLEAAAAAAQVSAELAAPLVARLWFTPWRIDAGETVRAREARWLAHTAPIALPTPAGPLSGFTAGTGPTVLLVHGWGDRASRFGAFVEPLVDAGFRVVGVDLPGHGDNPPGGTDLYEMADALAAVMWDQNARGVIAHSMGAVATARALQHGVDIGPVCMLAPAARLESAVDRFAELFALPAAAIAGLRAEIQRRFGPDVWAEFHADALVRDWDRPGLVVADRDDEQVPRSDVQLVADAWPGAQLIETQGLGHTRVLRDPEVVEQVTAFLRATAATSHAPRQFDGISA
ncbi:MAG: hypothetical protein QOE05_1242 [Actinomycetota bacterium]|jgi:pimeloyl-ACP methyl ester carboxylesterase|nr:hypothetical protein [Actinomycetota bacterium]